MRPKYNLTYLVLGHILILSMAMASVFYLMVIGNKEHLIEDLKNKLDTSTLAMVSQLKANQVPFSASIVDPGVFIINQADGSVVVDRRSLADDAKKIWDEYKTKIIYEMQKQKRGWVEYPDRSTWSFNESKRIVRYIAIDELNWILAIEDNQPSWLNLFKQSVNPSVFFTIFLIFIFSSLFISFISIYFINKIQNNIFDSLKNNILNVNGEDKIWDETQNQIPNTSMNVEKKFLFSKESHSVNEDDLFKDVSLKQDFKNKTSKIEFPEMPQDSQKPAILPESPREIKKVSQLRQGDNIDNSVDVQHINSPVLRRILKQFREK